MRRPKPSALDAGGRQGHARDVMRVKAIEPILEELPVAVARLNIDEEPGIASRYDVLSIPTVILFEGGEPRGAVVGVRPRAHFEQWLSEVLPAGE